MLPRADRHTVRLLGSDCIARAHSLYRREEGQPGPYSGSELVSARVWIASLWRDPGKTWVLLVS